MNLKAIILLMVQLFALTLAAQDSTIEKKYELIGYVKDLHTVSFDKGFTNLHNSNLVHNRLNLKAKPSQTLSAALEVRSRLFWNDRVIPGFASQLRNENELFNLSALLVSEKQVVLHTNIERFWVEYRKPKWNFRAGRQRINWGMAKVWNPNDIFNTYNFLDFDYEERPGCDAVKYQRFFSDFSNVTLAASASSNSKIIAVAKYAVNRSGYDLQMMGGLYQDMFTIGAGWAGNIWDLGFKGEAQAFLGDDSAQCFNYTIELDYMFRNGWYVNVAFLHNGNGTGKPISSFEKFDLKPSPLNLMPSKWNMVASCAKELTPLLQGNMNVVFAPGTNLLILFPSLQYSVSDRIDVDLVWQSFFAEMQDDFRDYSHMAYLRFKYTF